MTQRELVPGTLNYCSDLYEKALTEALNTNGHEKARLIALRAVWMDGFTKHS